MIMIYCLLLIVVHAALCNLMAAETANPWRHKTPEAKQAQAKEFRSLYLGTLPFILLVCWGIYDSLSRY